jgi:hypothetical protein
VNSGRWQEAMIAPCHRRVIIGIPLQQAGADPSGAVSVGGIRPRGQTCEARDEESSTGTGTTPGRIE